MKRTYLAVLLAAASIACTDDSTSGNSPSPTCGPDEFQACGGDVEGRWAIESGCVLVLATVDWSSRDTCRSSTREGCCRTGAEEACLRGTQVVDACRASPYESYGEYAGTIEYGPGEARHAELTAKITEVTTLAADCIDALGGVPFPRAAPT